MTKRLGLKVLAISIALVMVASGVAMYGYSGTEGEEGISESEDGKGVISLVAPPFIGVAGAAETAGGGGGGAPRAGTTFLEEEAGISAYVSVGQEINLEKAKAAFKSIETANESYIIGEIDLPRLPEFVDPHAYVHKDGWIVAYYSKYAPASKIMEWDGYDGGVITTTTLADAIHIICDEIEVNYAIIKDGIRYYDFEYPNANRIMLVTDMVSGTEYQSDSFNVEIPAECWLYEGSWSHYTSGCFKYMPWCYSRLKIDTDTISELKDFDGTYYRYGKYTSKQLEADVLHTILIEHDTATGWKGTTGVVTALIYRIS